MYVRVCACVGQTLLSYARGFPPRGDRKRNSSSSSSALLSTFRVNGLRSPAVYYVSLF